MLLIGAVLCCSQFIDVSVLDGGWSERPEQMARAKRYRLDISHLADCRQLTSWLAYILLVYWCLTMLVEFAVIQNVLNHWNDEKPRLVDYFQLWILHIHHSCVEIYQMQKSIPKFYRSWIWLNLPDVFQCLCWDEIWLETNGELNFWMHSVEKNTIKICVGRCVCLSVVLEWVRSRPAWQV